MFVNQKHFIEDFRPLTKNSFLDNDEYQKEFVDTFLSVQYYFNCSMESPGICFVIGIRRNRKIHFANQFQVPRELLLHSNYLEF